MSIRKITIHSPCDTTPLQARMGGATGFDDLQWRGTDRSAIWQLKLPGGVFVGHPNRFTLTITGNRFQPAQPLTLLRHVPNTLISRYVYSVGGAGCLVNAPAPEIVIEANFRAKRKPKTKAKRK